MADRVDVEWLAGRLGGNAGGDPGGSGTPGSSVRGPSARGIAAAVTDLVRGGELAPGAELPTVRALAGRLGVSPATVSAAWTALRHRRIVATAGRRGSVIAGPPDVPHPARFERIGRFGARLDVDLAVAAPDPALLPPLGPALTAAAASAELNRYERVPVTPALLAAVAPTWPFPAEAWLAVGGGYEGVQLVLQAAVVPGDRVAVEEPTAARLLDLLDLLHVRPVPVACDGEGPVPASLAAALAERPAVFLYQPRAQTPGGWTVPAARAAALADLLAAAEPSPLVVEDDGLGPLAASPLHGVGARLPTRTVLVRSYSKACGPDLRTAVLGGAAAVVERARVLRSYGTGWTSRLLQDALAYVLRDPGTATLLDAARARYRARREALAAALAGRGHHAGDADGLMLWLPVADEPAALVTLAAHGIAVAPGSRYTLTGTARRTPHVRVATGTLPDDPAEVERIASVLALAASP